MYKCQSCGSDNCIKFLDLGKQPICNHFLKKEFEIEKEKKYPLELIFCKDCTLVQLSFVPPGKETYGEAFDYLTQYTSELVKNFTELANTLIQNLNLRKDDYVIDIGSNDGTFLKPFKEKGIRVLGIEPSPIPCDYANKNGIPTINKRFEDAIDEVLAETKGKVKVIAAFNVLAHTDTIHGFLEGINGILSSNDAIFISQSHYLPNLINEREYDSVYHEHARYYSLTSVSYLLKLHGLNVYDAKETSIHGGSILVYASKREREISSRAKEILKKEEKFGKPETYSSFAAAVEENRKELIKILLDLKAENKKIVGIGAPMKSSTLLNYCNIDSKILDYLAELNPLRIGSYSPGMHIKILAEAEFFKGMPDAALILSWNVAEHIIKNFRKKGYNGIFVIPMPKPRIIK